MLTMLPLARLETADAITSVYPTPSSLFKVIALLSQIIDYCFYIYFRLMKIVS